MLFEFLTGYNSDIPGWMFIYAGILTAKYDLNVASILFQIKPAPKKLPVINRYDVRLFGKKEYFWEDIDMLEGLEQVPYIGEKIKTARLERIQKGMQKGIQKGIKSDIIETLNLAMNKLIISVLLFLSASCQQNYQLQFWPENGATIKNITWEIPVADSSAILQEIEGHWILPQPSDSVKPTVTITRHCQPNINSYQHFFNKVSQEILYDSGAVSREFYRFEKQGILLLGTESRDSTQLITIYEPPMVLIPRNLENLDTTYFYEGIPQVWDATADSLRQQQKTRLRLTPKQKGTMMLDSVAVPAWLVQMTLSMDGTVNYAGTDLIVPDAIMMQSNLLMIKGLGPVLEWGVRSRKSGCNGTATHEIDPDLENQHRFEEREYYIEVTIHQKADDRVMDSLKLPNV